MVHRHNSLPPPMLPLARQETRASIFSWWSDSNPGLGGPTINLHTAAKPLMRFMYDQQASAFVKKHINAPLSCMVLEVYIAYLLCKHVADRTRAMILSHLTRRAIFVDDARAMLRDDASWLAELLGSPHISQWARHLTCNLIGVLAEHTSLLPVIFVLGTPLVGFLRSPDTEVITWGLEALVKISLLSGGAQAVVTAEPVDYLLGLLESPIKRVRNAACRLLGAQAACASIVPAILQLKLCPRLVSFLRTEDVLPATIALCGVARSSDSRGAQAIVDANAQDFFQELLESPNKRVQEWACRLVGNLSHLESIAPIILKLNICPQLVSLSYWR
ncbi:armadillo-type protein [Mycena capillaripes]|nr:armadillo-type protein [Mycena capillaripes]